MIIASAVMQTAAAARRQPRGQPRERASFPPQVIRECDEQDLFAVATPSDMMLPSTTHIDVV